MNCNAFLCKGQKVVMPVLMCLLTSVASAQTIINPSFEDGANGCTVSKMQLQTKDGL